MVGSTCWSLGGSSQVKMFGDHECFSSFFPLQVIYNKLVGVLAGICWEVRSKLPGSPLPQQKSMQFDDDPGDFLKFMVDMVV